MVEDGTASSTGAVALAELALRDCVFPGPENALRRVVDAACAAVSVLES
ncbi:MAG: hypothetical protein JWO26_2889 [Rhodospirillales bacterium]|nr:hypothetical protein [Rhodospirillales bacterium]